MIDIALTNLPDRVENDAVDGVVQEARVAKIVGSPPTVLFDKGFNVTSVFERAGQ